MHILSVIYTQIDRQTDILRNKLTDLTSEYDMLLYMYSKTDRNDITYVQVMIHVHSTVN